MVLIILGIIMTIIAAGISTIANKDTILEKNKQNVIDNFAEVTTLKADNNDIKIELTQKIETLEIESYSENHEEYISLINQYQENYKLIKKHTKEIEKSCEKEIEDSRVNVMCKSYKLLYEESTNIYIETITTYNDILKKYNETATTPYEEIELLEKEYIDYNNDNVFLGKPKEEPVG